MVRRVNARHANRSGYMTLREGAAWLGIGTDRAAARRLQRLLAAEERRLGRRLMRRSGGRSKPRLFVTQALLRSHLPEHFDRRGELAEALREYLDEVRAEQTILKTGLRAVGARIRRHGKRIQTLEDREKLPRLPRSGQLLGPTL